jgi:hypothetical protein
MKVMSCVTIDRCGVWKGRPDFLCEMMERGWVFEEMICCSCITKSKLPKLIKNSYLHPNCSPAKNVAVASDPAITSVFAWAVRNSKARFVPFSPSKWPKKSSLLLPIAIHCLLLS